MEIIISLDAKESEHFDRDALADLAREMNIDLNREFEAKFEEREGISGGKGLAEITPIIVSLVGAGGAVVSLMNIFNTYFSKAPAIELELERKDGQKIKLKASDIDPERLRQTMSVLDAYLKE